MKGIKITSDEKVVIGKVVRVFEMNKFSFDIISIGVRLLPQKWFGRFRYVLNRTDLESSDQAIRIGPKLGFWT